MNAAVRIVSLTDADLEEMLARAAESGARKALEERPAEPADWLDARGVAELMHVDPRSVQKYVKRSGLPAHRVGLRLYRYRRTEVLAWLASRGAIQGADKR